MLFEALRAALRVVFCSCCFCFAALRAHSSCSHLCCSNSGGAARWTRACPPSCRSTWPRATGPSREFHEPGFWHVSAQFWRGFVVSANLRNTCLSFDLGKMTVSANLRNSPQNFQKHCAEIYRNPGSRNPLGPSGSWACPSSATTTRPSTARRSRCTSPSPARTAI